MVSKHRIDNFNNLIRDYLDREYENLSIKDFNLYKALYSIINNKQSKDTKRFWEQPERPKESVLVCKYSRVDKKTAYLCIWTKFSTSETLVNFTNNQELQLDCIYQGLISLHNLNYIQQNIRVIGINKKIIDELNNPILNYHETVINRKKSLILELIKESNLNIEWNWYPRDILKKLGM